MRRPLTTRRRRRGQGGVYLIVTALAMAVLISSLGLSFDTGRLYGIQRDLQSAADAGALHGVDLLNGATQAGVLGSALGNELCLSSVAPKVPLEAAILQAAAFNGYGTYAAQHGCSVGDGSYCYGTYGAAGAPGHPGGVAPTATSYDVIFYDGNLHPVDPLNCSPTAENLVSYVEIVTPVPAATVPVPPSDSRPAANDCTTNAYNCVEVIVGHKVRNVFMASMGQTDTVVWAAARGYGAASGGGGLR